MCLEMALMAISPGWRRPASSTTVSTVTAPGLRLKDLSGWYAQLLPSFKKIVIDYYHNARCRIHKKYINLPVYSSRWGLHRDPVSTRAAG
jgi:hypothetical protein